MRPLDFYRIGVADAPNADSEARRRTVVSRLYYGLHHEACCRFFRENPASHPLHRYRRHAELRDRFYELDHPVANRTGVLLNELRLLRAEADYNLSSPIRFRDLSLDTRQLLNRALVLAQRLLDALETFSPGEAEDGCKCPQSLR